MKTFTFKMLIHMTILVTIFNQISLVRTSYENREEHYEHFVNEWAVRIPSGQLEDANLVARDLGYENLGKLMGFDDVYLMKKSEHAERSKREAVEHTHQLHEHPMVLWAEQQMVKRLDKRGFLRMFKPISLAQRDRIQDIQETDNYDNMFNDPMWPDEWFLHDTRRSCDLPVLDLNVVNVWKMGFTGKGIPVTLLDDGLEWRHSDLLQNYDQDASYDMNGGDSDPTPRYDLLGTNKHGTRCAGEISMVANNSKCGVGVAYESRIGGIRMLDGPVTDATEGKSLRYNCDYVHIYSASWGPTDDGATLSGPGRLASEAIEICVTQKGRNGLGSIYIWASGNGGNKGDNCDCDGYTSSMYTISIGSVSENGKFPWYGEMCASTMACTNSGGAYSDQKISTVDLHNSCTDNHSGTSAAAPLAAGVMALVLQANPKLTWRDCQHLVICTAEPDQILDNPEWFKNGIGLFFNQRFGFGVLNAERMVKTALKWTNVPRRTKCEVKAVLPPVGSQERELRSNKNMTLEFNATSCISGPDKVVSLEHVQFQFDADYTRRGALEIVLISPSGTISPVLNPRVGDSSDKGFKKWTFLSVHFWGENPEGIWKLVISDNTYEGNKGTLNDGLLILHGSDEIPEHFKNGIHCGLPRKVTQATNCNKPSRTTSYWPNFFSLFEKK